MGVSPYVVIAAAAVLVVFVVWACIRKEDRKFDERQLQKRANAFRCGFFSMVGGNLLMMILFSWKTWTDRVDNMFTIIVVFMTAVVVFAVYSILNDAFFGNKENPKGYLGICLAVLFCNSMIVIRHFMQNGTLLQDGKVTMTPCTNLVMVVVFLIIALSIIVKMILNQREASDEES